jgi:RimJ/RimL family protein N-acetyltransferase
MSETSTLTPDAVRLRDLEPEDLPVLFAQQLDVEANRMAAFTLENPSDRRAFDAHWKRILADEAVTVRTVLAGDRVAGHVESFPRFGRTEVAYWIGRDHWGRGIATRALELLLAEIAERPLFARAAEDNAASLRVLEKCGFEPCGRDRACANARGAVTVEVVLQLGADG